MEVRPLLGLLLKKIRVDIKFCFIFGESDLKTRNDPKYYDQVEGILLVS